MADKFNIGIVGYGNIGQALHTALNIKYKVVVADNLNNQVPCVTQIDLRHPSPDHLVNWMVGNELHAVICTTPYYLVKKVAQVAAQLGIAYFDPTEDRETTEFIKKLESTSVLVPQCGLAPGAVSIIGSHLIQQFDKPVSLEIRVGALPKYPNNHMQYNLTWSTDGLINEYCHPSEVIEHGIRTNASPLGNYELVTLQGKQYEAFNTSGGLGTLCETYEGKLKTLNYKTMRYVGHHQYMSFLLNDLKMNENQKEFTDIFNKTIPKTCDDVVLIMIKAVGLNSGKLIERNYVKEISRHDMFSAIQLTTAYGIAGVVDSWFYGNWKKRSGFVKQEEVDFNHFIYNDWGALYA